MAITVWLSMGYDFGYVIASDALLDSAGGFSGSSNSEERCHGNHFLAFYIWDAHWRHLANTTEPSMCDAALSTLVLDFYTIVSYYVKPVLFELSFGEQR